MRRVSTPNQFREVTRYHLADTLTRSVRLETRPIVLYLMPGQLRLACPLSQNLNIGGLFARSSNPCYLYRHRWIKGTIRIVFALLHNQLADNIIRLASFTHFNLFLPKKSFTYSAVNFNIYLKFSIILVLWETPKNSKSVHAIYVNISVFNIAWSPLFFVFFFLKKNILF